MSAELNVKYLSEAILHLDEERLKNFNISRDDLVKQYTNSFVAAIRTSTKNMFSKDHAAQMVGAMIEAMKKIAVDTRATDDESKVQVIVNGLDFVKIFSDSIQLDVDEGADPKEIVGAITRSVVQKFNDMKLSKTTVFVVECEYLKEADFWMPKNMQAFFETLTASAFGRK